ncbi:MAG: hypothetical protein ACI3YD_04430 [Alloprevotella sp.]
MFSGLQGDTSYVSCAKLHRFLVILRDFTLKMSEIAKFLELKPSEIANFLSAKPSEIANFSALDGADAKGAPFSCCHYFWLEFPFSDYQQTAGINELTYRAFFET